MRRAVGYSLLDRRRNGDIFRRT